LNISGRRKRPHRLGEVGAGVGAGAGVAEAEPAALEVAGPEVGRHDDDGVGEVGHPPGRVGQPALAEHLEQQVEQQRVGLLHLVEQDDGERLFADFGREQPLAGRPGLAAPAAGGASPAARRGDAADKPLHVVRRTELAHVEPGHPVGRGEEELGQCLGHLGLADAGRADEQSEAIGRRGRLSPPSTSRCRSAEVDRLRLADHPSRERRSGVGRVQRHVVVE
jgi:hypothetical protein